MAARLRSIGSNAVDVALSPLSTAASSRHTASVAGSLRRSPRSTPPPARAAQPYPRDHGRARRGQHRRQITRQSQYPPPPSCGDRVSAADQRDQIQHVERRQAALCSRRSTWPPARATRPDQRDRGAHRRQRAPPSHARRQIARGRAQRPPSTSRRAAPGSRCSAPVVRGLSPVNTAASSRTTATCAAALSGEPVNVAANSRAITRSAVVVSEAPVSTAARLRATSRSTAAVSETHRSASAARLRATDNVQPPPCLRHRSNPPPPCLRSQLSAADQRHQIQLRPAPAGCRARRRSTWPPSSRNTARSTGSWRSQPARAAAKSRQTTGDRFTRRSGVRSTAVNVATSCTRIAMLSASRCRGALAGQHGRQLAHDGDVRSGATRGAAVNVAANSRAIARSQPSCTRAGQRATRLRAINTPPQRCCASTRHQAAGDQHIRRRIARTGQRRRQAARDRNVNRRRV